MEIDRKDLEEIVYQKIKKLPEFFKKKLDNVEFFVDEGNSLRLLGLYHGVPFNKRSNYNLAMPDKIIIYKRAFEKICRNRKELEDKVEKVLLHEIGHYFGFSEKQLRDLDY
ncbi:MAG TPA: metallopeptidase family protein [bacterium]|jgi:predicted Zn-dependent protease with MMP-like domain|uniref:Possibl zinc metallo-peptidase n=1 Tax=candidate division TA06 bacterium ADurb.Bin131 TaxID=1852827 RepID=A0A1V6CA36_UNCT6|nr:MAG: Possibl zinc metallo-peptidase [candidate division TA06 bacterium ADurb.Bin131]HOC03475.1 metallopeptidase family protein [bacterium]HOQ82304.1 metallopeptidase family protein [bacterium]HQL65811.1 metallopeptidase family protein [bacterium]HRV04572.1 metallopeptidase family protein [Candidatus Ratteibacteria bacterium]